MIIWLLNLRILMHFDHIFGQFVVEGDTFCEGSFLSWQSSRNGLGHFILPDGWTRLTVAGTHALVVLCCRLV